MPIRGRKPKPPEVRRNRVPPRHDWTEVANVPNELAPQLPRWSRRFMPMDKDGTQPRDWPAATLRWWDVVSHMPHAVLWEPSDWQFAYDTALVVAAFHCGQVRFAKEMRDREKILGTTADARRDLRIRYVDPDTMAEVDPAETATVTAMADYQRMVDGDT